MKSASSTLSVWIANARAASAKAFTNGWEFLSSKAGDLYGEARDGIKSMLEAARTSLGNVGEAIIEKTAEWKDGFVGWLDGVVNHAENLADPEIPGEAKQEVVASVQRFWSNMLQAVRSWLFGVFGFLRNDKSDEPPTSVGAGASSPGAVSVSPLVSPDRLMQGIGAPAAHGLPNSTIPMAPVKSAKTGEMMGYAMDQLRKEGVPEGNLRAAAALLVGQAQMESGLNPNEVHDHGTGFGIYGARLGRMDRMLSWEESNKFPQNSAEGQMRYMAHEAMTTPSYGPTKQALMNASKDNLAQSSFIVTQNFESPAVINDRSGATAGAYETGADSPTAAAAAIPEADVTATTPSRAPPPSATTDSPAAAPSAEQYPDHGFHKRPKPHVQMNGGLGMLFVAVTDYA